jgi:hypothetical protein
MKWRRDDLTRRSEMPRFNTRANPVETGSDFAFAVRHDQRTEPAKGRRGTQPIHREDFDG